MIKKFRWVVVSATFLFACNSEPGSDQGNTNTTASKKSLTAQQVMTERGCNQCHRANTRLVGPSYMNIASKGYSTEEITELIRKPNPDNWPGFMPMIGIKITDEEGKLIADYINSL